MPHIEAFAHQGFKAPELPNHYNEDRFVAGSRIFAAIDGSTSIVNIDMNGLNTSAYTSNFLVEFLQAHDRDDDLSAGDILQKALHAFQKHLQDKWPDVLALGKKGPCAAVAVLKLHGDKASFASLADCAIVAGQKDAWQVLNNTSEKHYELDLKLAEALFAAMQKGLPAHKARNEPEVAALREQNRVLQGNAYGVFSADPAMVEFMHSDTFDLADYDKIALFSDGMVWPDATGLDASLRLSAQKMAALGLHSYYNQMKSLYDADPDFVRFQRLKHMDDATALLLHF